MNKYRPLVILSLLICLYIYTIYRTEKTVINQVIIFFFSLDTYMVIKSSLSSLFPINDYFIYSLPEGLWLFCITVTSSFFYLEVSGNRLNFVFFPLLFSAGLEILQLLHFTNGRFDFMDLAFSLAFWLAAFALTEHKQSKENIFNPISFKSVTCAASYFIVYLAHVNQ